MGIEDLRAKYGPKAGYKALINRAIRAEYVAGDDFIDAFSHIRTANIRAQEIAADLASGKKDPQALSEELLHACKIMSMSQRCLSQAKDKMEQDIKVRYGMSIERPEKDFSEDLPE